MKRLVPVSFLVFLLLTGGAVTAHAAVPFALNHFDVASTAANGSAALQAGSHPYAFTTSFEINNEENTPGKDVIEQELKDSFVEQIPGLIGNTTAVPQCSGADFSASPPGNSGVPLCSDSSAIGVATIATGARAPAGNNHSALYNLTPPEGSVAEFGFVYVGVRSTIDFKVKPAYPYNLVAVVRSSPQVVPVFNVELTIWGEPSSPVHNPERGACLYTGASNCISEASRTPFLTLPRSCQGPQETTYAADSWQSPARFLSNGDPDLSDPRWTTGGALTHDATSPSQPAGFTGCEKLSVSPTTVAKPTTAAAGVPAGFDFDLSVPNEGLVNPNGLASADLRKVEVKLPRGMTTNPSLATGLVACSIADLELETVSTPEGAGCPSGSKIGSLEVDTPLLTEGLSGSLFVAKPFENLAGNGLLGAYMVIKSPRYGIMIKQPLRIEADPGSGQLTAIAEELPQFPFSHLKVHFREGPRAPLTTPSACGTYRVESSFVPWSGGAEPGDVSSFEIAPASSGSCGGDGGPRFAPKFEAGTAAPLAGSFSPFALKLERDPGSSQFRSVETTLPEGLLGKLAGVTECTDSQLAAATTRNRTGGGTAELVAPSCPRSSEVGLVFVGAGSGEPTYVQGRAYLAGPYRGAPLSLAIITPAVAGPFDLGSVVVRNALYVDPVTSQIRAVSDSIPSILQGIPLDIRSISLNLNRPEFTLDPTSCEPTGVLGGATSLLGQSAALSARFQVGGCGGLGFEPKLALRLSGSTQRGKDPALRAVLTQAKGQANIHRFSVVLPKSQFVDQRHVNNPCTRVQFNAGAGDGAECPAKSILGHARAFSPLLAKPLEGPVYFRSNGGERELPDLVASLDGQVHLNVVGFIDSVHRKGSEVSRVRSTFAAVPDAPVEKFVLNLKGGKNGLLRNSANLCKVKNVAQVKALGQNNKPHNFTKPLATECGKHGKKSHGKQAQQKK